MTERAIILSKGRSLSLEDFPLKAKPTASSEEITIIPTLKDSEIYLIRKALNRCGFNQKAAADTLGISRDALIRKMKKYNISIKREINPS